MIQPYKTKYKENLISYWFEHNPKKDFSEIKYLVGKIAKKNFVCYLAHDGKINGFVLVQKKRDKYELTLVAENSQDAYKLMKYLIWHINKDLYVHFDKWDSNIKLLQKFGFRFSSTKESKFFDLFRKFDRKYYFPKKDLTNDDR